MATKIDILGAKYSVSSETEEDNPKLVGNSGLCENYSKRIIIDTSDRDEPTTVENYDGYCHRVLRHEGFHAIFHEAGLSKYNDDEDLVEALAVLYPKIKVIMDKLDSLDVEKL